MLVIKIFTSIAFSCLNLALDHEHSCLSFLNEILSINVDNSSEVYYGSIRVIHKGTISTKFEGLRLDSSKNLVVEQPMNFLNETFRWSGKISNILFCRAEGIYYVCYDYSEEEFRNKFRICEQPTTSSDPQDSRQWCFLLLIVPVIIIIIVVIIWKKKCNNEAKGSGMEKLQLNDQSKNGNDPMHCNNNNNNNNNTNNGHSHQHGTSDI